MIEDRKPELNEELLVHYGIRGMKWGIRKGRNAPGSEGMGRLRRSGIERNERTIKRIKDAAGKKGRLRHRIPLVPVRIVLGQKNVDKAKDFLVNKLDNQNTRLRSGKHTVTDRLTVLLRTTPLDPIVSVRPK